MKWESKQQINIEIKKTTKNKKNTDMMHPTRTIPIKIKLSDPMKEQ